MTMKNVNYNREKVSVDGENIDDFEDYISLKEVKKEVDRLIEMYGEDSRIQRDQRAYSEDTYLYVQSSRLETDDEMAYRIAKEEQRAQQRLDQERAEFERLKAKFG
jgi:hypothetical protein